jgi:hypothetical protein
MAKVSDLLRQGRREEVWTKYCGFLDLGLDNFMEIQRRLLTEQLQLSGRSELGRSLMGDDPPQEVEEFRKRMRLTTYEDYASYLDESARTCSPRNRWPGHTRQAGLGAINGCLSPRGLIPGSVRDHWRRCSWL